MKILIYNSGGGLGDSIQLFDIIYSLREKFGSNNIFYLSAHKNHFNNSLFDYNIQLNELKTDIIYFGFRFWHLFKSKKNILKNNNETIGRIAAFYSSKNDKEKLRVGGCGFFECIDDEEAAKMLFDTAKNWLEKNGYNSMDGPINFGERDKWWGCLVEGFNIFDFY